MSVELDSIAINPPAQAGSKRGGLEVVPTGGGARLLLVGVYISLLAGQYVVRGVDVRLPALFLTLLFAPFLLAFPAKYGRSATAFFVSWMLLMGWLATSALWSPPGGRTGEILFDLMSMAVFVSVARGAFARADHRAYEAIWWVVYASSIIFAVAGAFSATTSIQGRVSAFGGGPNVFVRIMLIGMVAGVALYAKKPGRWPLLFGLPVFLFMAIMSGSRGGLFALAVAVPVVTMLLRRFNEVNVSRRIGFSAAGSLIAIFLFAGGRLQQFVAQRFLVETVQQGNSSGRDTIWADAWVAFAQSPLVGQGLDTYYALVGSYVGMSHPHNIFLAAGSDGGVVAVALMMSAVAFAVRYFDRVWNFYESLPWVGALMYGVVSLFSGYWYDSRFIWFFLLMAISQGDLRQGKEVGTEVDPVPRTS